MTSRQNSKNELILVAIDVAKHSHEVLILWPDGHQKGYRVANSFEDIAVRLRVKKKVQNLNAMWYKEFAKNFATQGDFGHESP